MINVINESVIEVDYLSHDRQKNEFYIRKSRGTDDISGDSNVYSLNITESIAGDYVFNNEKLEYIIGNIK